MRAAFVVLWGLLALCVLQPGAAEDAGVSIAWAPSQKCDDSPGGNCALCNEYALQCLVCLGGYGFNGKGECQLCTMANLRLCLTCDLTNKPYKCLKCLGVPDHDVPLSWSNPGFPVFQSNSTGNCQRCWNVDNIGCLTCDPTGTRCTQCNDGFYRVNGTCARCLGSNCQTCDLKGRCIKCLSSRRGPSYGLTANKTCLPCQSKGCVSCDADYRKCNRCLDGLPSIGERGYGSDGKGSCMPCASPLCAQCQKDYKKCTMCTTNPYSLTPVYLTPAGTCKRCTLTGCMACSSSGKTCTQCQDGYILTASKQCAKLPKCSVPNCYDCRGNTKGCNTCAPQYFMAKPNRCQKCMANCEVCSPGKNNCKQCVLNFGLVNHSRCWKCNTVNAEYSFCQKCDGDYKRCTLCWPADKFRPDPKTGGCVRYRLPDTIW